MTLKTSHMQALLLDAEHKTALLKSIPIPSPSPHEVLVHVHTIALNPVDSLYTFNPLGSTGRTIGSDFAGTIAALGPSVPSSSHLKPGDKVAGFLQGACSINDRPGAFAEYVVIPYDLVWKVSKDMTFEEACTVSLCGLTAAQALFYRMGMPAPFEWVDRPISHETPTDSFAVFIYGASTSVGLYAAQLVRRAAEVSYSKVYLIGAASERHFAMLKVEPYSYDHLVDYRDANWPQQVLTATAGKGVEYAYDCISEGNTVQNTAATLASNGKIAVVRSRQGGAWDTPAEELRREPSYGAVWEGLGEDVQYQGMVLPASQEARAFAVAFYRWLSEGGKLRANPVRLMPGGLGSVTGDGLRLLGSGNMEDRDISRSEEWMKPVSAEKLVYRIAG